MKIKAIAHGLDLAKSYGHRSPGVHISDLYNSYYAMVEPKRYAKNPDSRESIPMERWGIGMAFEEMLERALIARVFNTNEKEEVTRPGEFETEHTVKCKRVKKERTKGCGCACGGGILYSPDLLIFNGKTRCGEIKLNSMSAKGVPWKLGSTYSGFAQKYDKYVTQVKNYCYHLGLDDARLYSFSVREMVNFNEKDIFRGWDISFNRRELVEEWDLIHRHGKREGLLT